MVWYRKKYKINLQKEGGPDHKVHSISCKYVTSGIRKFFVTFEEPILFEDIVRDAKNNLIRNGCLDKNCETRRAKRKDFLTLQRVKRLTRRRIERAEYFPCSGKVSLCEHCLGDLHLPRHQ